MLLYFNSGGPAELRVSWKGPGFNQGQIPGSVFSHRVVPMIPLNHEVLVVDPEKACRGEQLFGSLICAACHSLDGQPLAGAVTAKAWTELKPAESGGCLGGGACPLRAPV